MAAELDELSELFGALSDDVELSDGGIYSLRVGTSDPNLGHALLSAMVRIDGEECEVLWSGI